jgi:hypothetical protein
MDTMTNGESDALMTLINRLPFLTKRIIKLIAALARKINNHPLLEPYIRPLLVLLSNIINIKGNAVLRELRPKFEEKLVSYVFYIDEIILDTIDISAYQAKHDILIHLNQIVKQCVQNQSAYEFYSTFI